MELLRTMLTVEVTRVKYMLRVYLRTRLHKVERYVMHCIDDPEVRGRLSQLEDAYALSFLKLVGTHLKSTVTSKMPGELGDRVQQEGPAACKEGSRGFVGRVQRRAPLTLSLTHALAPLPPTPHTEAFSSVTKQASAHPANDMIPAPDLGRHVFARVLRDLGQVQVYEDGGMHELNKGDLYIMRYNMLRPLLEDGAVQLI